MDMKKTTLLVLSLMLVPFFDYKLVQAIESESNVKTLLWPDGTRYVGGIVNGKRTGRGTIFWQEGSRFIGYFENDMRNGPGTMILPDGTVYRGYFKDDKLVYTETSIPTSDPNKIEDIERESLNQTAQVDTDSKNRRNLESRNPLSSPTSLNEKENSEPTPKAPQTKIAKVPESEKIEDTREPSPSIVAKTPESEKIEDTREPSPSIIAKTPESEKIEDTREPPLTQVGEPILGSSTKESLVEAIDEWANAWSNKNVSNYLSTYSKDFSVPGNRSRKNWENLRKDRLSRPKFIKVTLEYQRFVQVEEDVVDVFFRQTYSSNTYRDVTDKVLRMTKVLRMRKEDSDWKILIERAR